MQALFGEIPQIQIPHEQTCAVVRIGFALVCIGLHWLALVCIILHGGCIGLHWFCIGCALVCIGAHWLHIGVAFVCIGLHWLRIGFAFVLHVLHTCALVLRYVGNMRIGSEIFSTHVHHFCNIGHNIVLVYACVYNFLWYVLFWWLYRQNSFLLLLKPLRAWGHGNRAYISEKLCCLGKQRAPAGMGTRKPSLYFTKAIFWGTTEMPAWGHGNRTYICPKM